jgi:tetratricopeptide (TPR) repeat protein
MNKLYLKILFTGFIILGLTLPVNAQRSNGLTVEGTVSVEEGSVEGAIIQMFRDGRRLDNYGIGANGRYRVELNYNHEWTLIFARPGNFPQKIVVDTKVSREVLQSDPLFPPFPVDIKLFTEISGIDRTFSENTVLKIYYSDRVDNFISDLYYNDAQIKHLIDQAILQSQMIDREADFLAGLTRAEMAELRREYDQLIKAAENEYRNEKFLDALDGYQAASRVFPKEQYPKDRIAEINDLLGLLMVAEEMQQALAERLQELLAQADALYDAQNYAEARNAYHRALSVDPANRHAQQRSGEIAEILRRQQADQEYRNLITQGDNSFRELLYMDAKNAFQQALRLKPDESYPQQRIGEIDNLLAQQSQNAERLKSYEDAVFQAELNFERQFYERAISYYETALTHQPGDEVATRRIQEIRDLMNELANRTLYDRVIRTADRAFQRSQYSEALSDYEQAAELLPNEEYPRNQIEKIQEIFAEQERLAAEAEAAEQARLAAMQAEQDRQYAQAVSRGDSLFNLNEYEPSRTAYQSALQVKPDETYPQQRIDEIGQILAQLLSAQQAYDAAISRADRDFGNENFDDAKTAYTEAQQAKPEENYPTEQIARIDSIVEERARLAAEAEAAEQARLAAIQAEQDRQYAQAVSRGDSLFNLNEYEPSRTAYQSALQVKPDETYPQQRIDEIGQILAQLLSAQQAYDAAISRADRDFGNENFDDAKTAYTEAQQAKPEESWPAEQIVRIDSIVEERARLAAEAEAAEQARLAALQAEQDRQYAQAVSRGDSLFNLNEYESSRTAYQSALQVKPDETYPQQRIDEIGQILAQLLSAQQAYDAAIVRADRDFGNENFDDAKAAYTEAQQAKPEESWPAEQIVRIDSIVEERARLAAEAEAAEQARLAAIQAEQDRQYAQAVSRGDSLFNLNEYEPSRTAYQSALQVKPDETYPQQRIDEIGQILAQLLSAQQAYDAAISRADRDFGNENFDDAKAAFTEAQQAKPEESYPAEQIARIDSIVEERARLDAEAEAAEQARLAAIQAEQDRQYAQAVSRGDSLFNLNEYESSRTAYQSALQVKPDETYPQQRIDEIGQILVQLLSAQQAYDAAIARADREFGNENFDDAKISYTEVHQANPEESYPAEQIARIDSIVETRARLAAEAEAEAARLAAEAEAAEQARLAALQAEQDRQYAQAVSRGDSLFNLNEYEPSGTAYQSALQVKPDETYPQQRIEEIKGILQEFEHITREYQNAVTMADQQFNVRDYSNARTNYEKALEIRPEETYPKDKIAEVERILARQELDENYRTIILAADEFFNSESWDEAKNGYETALEIKPDESYPRSQIVKIDNLLRQQQERELAEQRAAEDMERRRAEIEQRQREMSERQDMSETGLNQLYDEYIQLADGFFDNQRYNVSRAWYFKAWDVKPRETYPPQRIEEINRIVNSLLLSQRDRDYQSFVNLADSTFRENQLAVARGWYNRALTIKPNENYPKEQLQAIAGLIEERMAGRSGELFNSHMQNATEAYENGNYNVARFWYRKALELRPDDDQAREGLRQLEETIR